MHVNPFNACPSFFSKCISFSDMRQGMCYLSVFAAAQAFSRVVCENPTSRVITRKQCCCSIGQGWSYNNEPCEPCPRSDTPEFNALCKNDVGTIIGAKKMINRFFVELRLTEYFSIRRGRVRADAANLSQRSLREHTGQLPLRV